MNFYHLVNPMGVFISRGALFEQTVLADVFSLYRPAVPGHLLGVEVQPVDDGRPAIDAVAVACDGGGTQLLFINSDPERDAKVEVSGVAGDLRGSGLRGTEVFQSRMESFEVKSDRRRLVLPPLSIARMGC